MYSFVMERTEIIEANRIAPLILAQAERDCGALRAKGVTPGLALILVDDDPYSHRMLDLKIRQAQGIGVAVSPFRFPKAIAQAEIMAVIERLNRDPSCHGIFIQAPLPDHVDAAAIYDAVDPAKDVDGYHPFNLGRLAQGEDGFVPCASLGAVLLLKDSVGDLSGKHAVVVGRSDRLGKPVFHLLLRENCTVTLAHSRTLDLPRVVGQADIVVAAIGKPDVLRAEWIRPGAVILDMGANLVAGQLVGDVDFNGALGRAAAINRPTNAIGPMTVALLLRQTIHAQGHRHIG